jgi:hypothetical protein
MAWPSFVAQTVIIFGLYQKNKNYFIELVICIRHTVGTWKQHHLPDPGLAATLGANEEGYHQAHPLLSKTGLGCQYPARAKALDQHFGYQYMQLVQLKPGPPKMDSRKLLFLQPHVLAMGFTKIVFK